MTLTCRDCGGDVAEGDARCRTCTTSARWNRRLVDDLGDAACGELFTGTELLARIWGR